VLCQPIISENWAGRTLQFYRSISPVLSLNNDPLIIRKSLIVLAKALSLEIVAEGIETEEQRRILEECGCSRFQGYLFGRPVPEEEFVARLALRAESDGEDGGKEEGV
ncbi:MAG: EAL domain-containing protein, partial [Leptospirillia bacterium]